MLAGGDDVVGGIIRDLESSARPVKEPSHRRFAEGQPNAVKIAGRRMSEKILEFPHHLALIFGPSQFQSSAFLFLTS
jgi:hypothetical protein